MTRRLASSWLGTSCSLAALAAASCALPEAAPAALAAGAWLVWGRRRWLRSYPLRAPLQTGAPDRNQPHPATGRPTMAQGMLFLGNEVGTGKEVWLNCMDARQHFLATGSTGAGKTEALLGLAANALSWGGGFIFIDGKGDTALFAKVHAMCRLFGREDSLLCLNFLGGGADLPGARVLSHRMNPFRRGAPDALTQLVASMMDEVGGDGALWKSRSVAMLSVAMRALCWLRDNDGLALSPGVVRDHLSLAAIMGMAGDERLPDHVAKGARAYLRSLPGFKEERGLQQSQTTLDQHGYLEMQHVRALGILADAYGHIFGDEGGVDVDIAEVMLNRRILVVLLPALEKSSDEVANLGRVIMASLKANLASTLGADIEGDWAQVVESRPTSSPEPFVVVADEAGHYLVDGFALLCAQARSIGLSMVMAAQDIPALKRLNGREGQSVVANTNTKLLMRTETMCGFEDMPFARDRVGLADLQGQDAGDAHVVFMDRLVRVRMFYPDVPRGRWPIRLPQLVSLDWSAEGEAR